jgi:hypothetical protein
MRNTKHILVTVLLVSVAVLAVVAMPVSQPVTTNNQYSCEPMNQIGDITSNDVETFRKGVLV